MTISNQQFKPEILAHIQALSDANPGWSRRKLSMQVCEWLQWCSPNGKLKDMSCRVALLELERAGLLHLPPAGPAPPKRTPRTRKRFFATALVKKSLRCSGPHLRIGPRKNLARRNWVTLKIAHRRERKQQVVGELTLEAIAAVEVNYAPEVEEPIEWLLLTTLAIETFEQATEKLNWYAKRWSIEVYHRTLKSGCKIEARQLGKVKRLEPCLAIDLVVAWRIFHLTKLGREAPNVPCTIFFEEAEWKALVAYKTKNFQPPETPPTLREAVRMVASLGGFLGRKCDGEPGTKSLWLGLQRLDDLTAMWKIAIALPSSPNPECAVSSEEFMGDG